MVSQLSYRAVGQLKLRQSNAKSAALVLFDFEAAALRGYSCGMATNNDVRFNREVTA
jgi:hypothetical protein